MYHLSAIPYRTKLCPPKIFVRRNILSAEIFCPPKVFQGITSHTHRFIGTLRERPKLKDTWAETINKGARHFFEKKGGLRDYFKRKKEARTFSEDRHVDM